MFARIDHGAAARDVGLKLADEEVIVFGDPRLGTQLMQTDPTIGYELPLRMLIWDSGGQTMVGYRQPVSLDAAYQVGEKREVLRRMTALLESLVGQRI